MAEATVAGLRAYETMLILQPELEEDAVKANVRDIGAYITGRGGTLDHLDDWGKRRLAYEIDGFQEGHYVILQFHADPSVVDEYIQHLSLQEAVMRHLVVSREDN